jgi:hypothetical protein
VGGLLDQVAVRTLCLPCTRGRTPMAAMP